MKVTRRQFVKGGVTAFTVSFAAPAFLSDIARAQGASRRNLVVLYLSGGNDALSTLIPYGDSFYYSRRPSIAVPAANVLQIGSDSSGKLLGLHPRLTGLRQIFNQGSLALIQRTGYTNSSRSHFLGTDIWSTANPANSSGTGWLGRYLDALPDPVDPLVAWSTVRELPHSLESKEVSVPAIPSVAGYSFLSPNGTTGAEASYSHRPWLPSHRTCRWAARTWRSSITRRSRPATRSRGIGWRTREQWRTRTTASVRRSGLLPARFSRASEPAFWVQLGGFDTHATQNTNSANAGYANLMGTVGDGLLAFYNDMRNQGLLNDTMVLQFSEFGRRISENGSQGTDHGAAGVMMAMGGGVQGGIYGTAASLNPNNVDARCKPRTTRMRPTSARCMHAPTTGSARIRYRYRAETIGRAR
jgi:uncharacterized protein (DUF1501 family)